MALNLTFDPAIGTTAVKENYYILGLSSDMKKCCNIIAKYFNITNSDLTFYINNTTQLSTVANHMMAVTIINSLVLRSINDIETIKTLIKKINEKIIKENLACRIKTHDDSRNLIESHHFILEQNNVNSQYNFRFTFEKQELSINDINLLPYLEGY